MAHPAQDQVVRLEKQWEWWLWRGFLADAGDIESFWWPDRLKWKPEDDPVDAAGYDPFLAFPS